MRKRARSMYVEAASRPNDDDETTDGSQWSPGENLKLLRMVYQQIPINDNLPFGERIEMINWKRVSTEERTEKEAQKQLSYLLSTIRNYRVLSEMLDDLEKVIELPLPKKQNAFSLFIEDNKDEIRKEVGSGGKKGAFVVVAAERFRQLSEKEREKYVTKAKLIRQTHDDYFINNNIEKKNKKKKASANKTEPVESPITVFWEYKKRKDTTVTMANARRMYAALDRSKKLKYILKFLGVNEGEKLNMEQYEKAEKVLTKEDLAICEEYEGRPKRLSAYNFFVKNCLGHKSDSMNASYNFKTVAEEWKNLSKEEKAKYEEMSKHTHENYVEEYIEYIKSLPSDRQPFEMNRILSKELHKKFPKKKRKVSMKGDSQDEEILAVIDVNQRKSKDHKESKMLSHKNESVIESPSFSHASASSPRKKFKYNTFEDEFMTSIPTNVIKTELDSDQVSEKQNNKDKTSEIVSETVNNNRKKSRKTSDSVSEADTDHQINDSSSSILNISKQIKFPGSLLKYYTQMVFDGPKEKAKRAFKRLNFEEKEELTKKYEKAKKKYLTSAEGKFKSPPPLRNPKRSKNSLSQSEISNEEISDFTSE